MPAAAALARWRATESSIPWLPATEAEREHLPADVLAEAARPLVGTKEEAAGQAKETLEVIDVAQLLIRSIRLRDGATQGTDA